MVFFSISCVSCIAWSKNLERPSATNPSSENESAMPAANCNLMVRTMKTGIIEIKTRRLVLRPFTRADVDEIHKLWTEHGVRKYLWDDEIIPHAQAQEVIARSVELFREEGTGLWTVSFHQQPALIGFCGYWYFREPPELEILYGISPELWGKNLATEAARAMLQYGFQYLGFDEIIASADAPNAASFRVMEKAGMKYWKRENKSGLDTIFYAISKDDFHVDNSVQFTAHEAGKKK